MKNISIDIVLLPDEEMTEKVISFNRDLKNRDDGIILNKEKGLPHITLAMGCIPRDKLPVIEKKVKESIVGLRILNLRVHKIDSRILSNNLPNASLRIKNVTALQNLHEKMINILKPYLLVAKVDSLYQDPIPAEITLTWINKFLRNLTFNNYKPHITIGLGRLENVSLPMNFTADKIVICQLGSYCTCQKVIKEFKLK